MTQRNSTVKSILLNALIAAVSLFVNGFGIYLTILAGIGAAPWDVFSLGLSKTLGILYGNASVTVSFLILAVDVLMKEPIGIAMFIDAVVVGKAVDFFNYLALFSHPRTMIGSVIMMIVGLFIIGYTCFTYMWASLGCGPRDTLLVGLAKRLKRIPIGAISIMILSMVTLVGYLLGGPVGIGTLICAFCTGPIMQFAFRTVHFDATTIHHQNLREFADVILGKNG